MKTMEELERRQSLFTETDKEFIETQDKYYKTHEKIRKLYDSYLKRSKKKFIPITEQEQLELDDLKTQCNELHKQSMSMLEQVRTDYENE